MRFPGGSDGNEQLTAIVATLLLVLLAVEGATLLNLGSLLTVHAFVGMLLIPVVALKLGGVGWRMLRYYRSNEEYVRRGPPHTAVRVFVAPVTIASTIALLATGVALLVLHQTHGTIVTLHQASFFVWLGAMSLHVLTRISRLPRALRLRVSGTALRLTLASGSVVAGLVIATLALPAADHLQDNLSAHVHVDSR